MNLDRRVEWAQRMLKLIDMADEDQGTELLPRRGELKGYRDDVKRWSEMLAITAYVENVSRHQWLSRGGEIPFSQGLSTAVSVQYT